MNFITMGAGILAIAYGMVMFFLRASRLEKFGKMESIAKRFGKKAAYTAHLIAYSIIPIFFGIFFAFAGFRGFSLF